ncbi:MAG: hypothetical protein R3E01_07955 [Pirellulaceae bacterium]|nr:hypothetical protein [Planctomycetales bacterium]
MKKNGWKSSISSALLIALLGGIVLMRGLGTQSAERDEQLQSVHLEADAEYEATTLEFPDLVDNNRQQRRVPIKVHLPDGDGPFPLVVFSHGAGGSWDANYAQAKHLAQHGFAVLCVEHVGSNTQRLRNSGRFLQEILDMTRDADEVLNRPRDISFAIDQAEDWNRHDPQLKGKLDLQHVGVAGHSFGAYTAAVVCGMRPALDWLQPTVPPGDGLGPDLLDSRVDCGVVLSPHGPGEPFFIEASYASLRTPMLGITGSRDRQQRSTAENRLRSIVLWPKGDKYLLWINNADHSAFSDSTGAGRIMLPSRTREDAQVVAREATLQFFRGYLLDDDQARSRLSGEHLSTFCRGRADRIELTRK